MVKNFDKHADNHQKVVKIEIVVDKSEDMARKKYGSVGVFFCFPVCTPHLRRQEPPWAFFFR